ncbi:hypothetical protein LINPERHAP1_LOCUS17794 [Linum perenne]
MHLKVNPRDEEGQGPLLLRPNSVQSDAGRGRGGLHPSVAAGLSSTLQRQWARGGRLGGARRGGGPNPGGPRPLLALLGPTDASLHRPRQGPVRPLGSGPIPRAIQPLRSISPSFGAAGGSSRSPGPFLGGGGPLQTSTGSASSSAPSSAMLGRQVGPINQDRVGPSVDSEIRSGKRQALSSDRLGPSKFQSAPVAKAGLCSSPVGHHTAPPNFGPPARPVIPLSGPAVKLGLTPTSSSKRKLLEDFERDVGCPSQFPNRELGSNSLPRFLQTNDPIRRLQSGLDFGDQNSSFFHQAIVQKHRRMSILSLEDPQGHVVTSAADMSRVATSFYEVLFSSDNPPNNFASLVPPIPGDRRVTTEMNELLAVKVSASEVRDAVFDIGAHQAPGPDGFPASFFQEFWDLVAIDLTSAVVDFFEWRPPAFDRLKINVDGAVRLAQGGGIGLVLRDGVGVVLFAGGRSFPHVTYGFTLEALAVREALRWAIGRSLVLVDIEGDAAMIELVFDFELFQTFDLHSPIVKLILNSQ